MRRTFLLTLACMALLNLFAQGPWVPHTVLVLLAPEADMATVERAVQRRLPAGVELAAFEPLGKRARYLRLRFAGASLPTEQDLARRLATVPGVRMTELDYYVQHRAVPNDPQYADQWHLVDMNMETVWNTTTGGAMFNGDRIAVGIIDSGVQPNHPDLAANMLVTGAAADEHGTQVAGVVGAVGDNGEGVSGVNWDVDLVSPASTTTLSDALEQFLFCLDLRQLYNEGNAQGSMIVALTISWGIPGLACGFGEPIFDDLGAAGILVVTSGPNDPTNIDVVDDYPATCPNANNIVVTSYGPLGQVPFAVGDNTVHLLAPGIDIPTTDIGGGYATVDGNSFAIPNVAGAVALLYANDCPQFVTAVSSDPQGTALAVKQAILDNVTPVSGATQITITGGKLNVAAAYDDLITGCADLCTELVIEVTVPEGIDPFIVVSGASGFSTFAQGTTLSTCLPDGCYTVNVVEISGEDVIPVPGTYSITDGQGVALDAGSHTGSFPLELGPIVQGCTNPSAFNYDPEATCDDGSCCTTTVFLNLFDSGNDGWEGATFTVTDAGANVVLEGTLEEGGEDQITFCPPAGCYTINVSGGTDPGEVFWSVSGEGQASGGASTTQLFVVGPGVLGCSDPDANNFSSIAVCDDGSCCYGTQQQVSIVATTFPGITWTLVDNTGAVVATQAGGEVQRLCVEPQCGYVLTINDDVADGNTITVNVIDPMGGTNTATTGEDGGPTQVVLTLGGTAGCTDPSASNYDPNALCDDGSCCTGNAGEVLLIASFANEPETVFYTLELPNGTLSGSVDMQFNEEFGDFEAVIPFCATTGCISGTFSTVNGTVLDLGGMVFNGDFANAFLFDPSAGLEGPASPGQVELCNGVDDDCDGLIDEGCGLVDNDGDGATDDVDCDDNDPLVNPFSPEICADGIDNDCDGVVDEDCGIADNDGDGFTADEDCDDNSASVNPAAEEVCADGIDNDCDGFVDEDCAITDIDGDGYPSDVDCDDTDPLVNPGALEICGDGIDNDCDGIDPEVSDPELTCPADLELVLPPTACAIEVIYDSPQFDPCNAGSITLLEGPASGTLLPPGETTVVYSGTSSASGASDLLFASFSDGGTGWTLDAEWMIGTALEGACAVDCTGNDPGEDHTPTPDNMLAGMNIGGCVSTGIHGFRYLTSPIVDASGVTGTLTLEYWRHLHGDYTPYMEHHVQVFDGTTWVTIWQHLEQACINDDDWTFQTFDVTAYKNAAFQVRFGKAVNASGAFNSGGWSVDDVRIYAGITVDLSCSFSITVLPAPAPGPYSCGPVMTVAPDPGTCTLALGNLVLADPFTGCTKDSLQVSGPDPLPLGLSSVTLTGWLDGSPIGTCNQEVAVVDGEAPTLLCPEVLQLTADASTCVASGVELPMPMADDNCTLADLFNDHPSNSYPLGTTLVTWTALDAAGNSTTCVQVVNVSPANEGTVVTCPDDLTLVAIAGDCLASLEFTTPSVELNCTTQDLVQVQGPGAGSLLSPGVYTLAFSQTGPGGNLFADDFSNGGASWSLGPEWQIGPAEPGTCGSSCSGNDPAEDHSEGPDNGVAGMVIGGCVSTAIHDLHYLTSPLIDAGSVPGPLTLSFWRHLHADYPPYMQHHVQVFNGNGWVTIWEHVGQDCINDLDWTFQSFDVSAYKNSAFQVRFGMAVAENGAFASGGWSLDDVRVFTDDQVACSFQVEVIAPAWYADLDGDGHGDPNTSVNDCIAPIGFVATPGDCNDNDPTVHPSASDACPDGVDNNCNGQTDEQADLIGQPCGSNVGSCNPGVWACVDGALTCVGGVPSTVEICGDGLDNDCDGQVDEGTQLIFASAFLTGEDCATGTISVVVVVDEAGGPLASLSVTAMVDGSPAAMITGSNLATFNALPTNTPVTFVVWNSANDQCAVELGPISVDCGGCDGSLTVNAGEDAIVYYTTNGFQPAPCTTLQATASGGNGPYTFQWLDGPAGDDWTVCPTVDTGYTVVVTDAQGCTATDVVYVTALDVTCGNSGNGVQICISTPGGNYVQLCTNQNAAATVLANNPNATIGPCPKGAATMTPGLTIHPNPNNGDVLVIALNDLPPGVEQVDLQLFDLTGKRLRSEAINVHGDRSSTTLVLNGDLAAGIYLVQVSFDGHDLTQRLVIAP